MVVSLYYYSPKGGGYGCKLYCIEDRDEGKFHAFLIYSDESGGEAAPAVKYFPYEGTEKQVMSIAERWIKKHLFKDFEKSLAQMLDEIPHGVV